MSLAVRWARRSVSTFYAHPESSWLRQRGSRKIEMFQGRMGQCPANLDRVSMVISADCFSDKKIITYAIDIQAQRQAEPQAPPAAHGRMQQAGLALFLVTATPAVGRPLAHAQQFRSLLLTRLRHLPAVEHIRKLQDTGTLSDFRQAHPPNLPIGRPLPARSCATDIAARNTLPNCPTLRYVGRYNDAPSELRHLMTRRRNYGI
jgi:hypothetical protein